MTTEDAREAAVSDEELLAIYSSADGMSSYDGWLALYRAGVVEGIRQAREAAEAGYGELAGSSAPTTPNAQTWMKAGALRAIAKIDALGGEQ